MSVVLLANVVATLFMVGMIWTVQVVHYPLFSLVGDGAFVGYEAEHTRRIAAMLALPWAVEGLTSVWLVASPPPGVGMGLALAGLAAAGIPVVVTVASSVQEHARLSAGFDAASHRRLVHGNAVRTAGWTLHGVIALAMLVRVA